MKNMINKALDEIEIQRQEIEKRLFKVIREELFKWQQSYIPYRSNITTHLADISSMSSDQKDEVKKVGVEQDH
jgi:hypothetical protein